jgi:hypothetical protein
MNNSKKVSSNALQNPFITPHPLEKMLSPKNNDTKNSIISGNRYGTF